MIRLLGAITGSALALATLLVLIGIPQFKVETNDIDRTLVTLPIPTTAVQIPQPDVQVEPNAVAEASTPLPSAASELSTTPDELATDLATGSAPEPDQPIASSQAEIDQPAKGQLAMDRLAMNPPSIDQGAMDHELIEDSQSWYAFWSPFRSELAASGFVAQLQRVTGLDYRVVKVKPGVYEVAFAYIEDTDITENLLQITAATGLDMPDGRIAGN